jgi:hypothetical protein
MLVWGGRSAGASMADGAAYCATVCTAPVPGTVAALRVDGSRLSWAGVASASAYDGLRGGLVSLRASMGSFQTATQACLADDLAATSIDDPEAPAVADGFWYLVRAVSCGGAGSWDGPGGAQQGSRDAEIAASPEACP